MKNPRSNIFVKTLASFVVAAMLMSISAWAINPSLSTIIPRGAKRGDTVELTFRGRELADTVDLVFHDSGLKLVEMGEIEAGKFTCKVEIAPDCTLGTKGVRVRTKTGVSNLRLFSVGALAEINEKEPNNDPDTVETIALGTTINGKVTNEDADFFALELAEGQRIAVEVEALRLGEALFDPKLRLFSPSGHERVAEDDTPIARQDAAFVFIAEEAGRHVLAISEAAYGGADSYRYRIHVGDFPRPLGVTPMGGVPGSEVQVTWLGDPALGAQSITVPAEANGTIDVAPTTEAGISPTAVPFRALAHPGVMEVEPNNNKEEATAGAVPGAFDGIIGESEDYDWYSFEGKAGQKFDVRVWAREMGSPLDSVLIVQNPSGSNLASNDDQGGPDSAMRITLAEDGVHMLCVHDHLRSGGETFAYRIEVTPITPSLEMGINRNDAVAVTVPQGNRVYVEVAARRKEFSGDIAIEYTNVPEGVTIQGNAVTNGRGSWPVVLSAATDAPIAGSLLGITGRWDRESDPLRGGMNQQVQLILGANKVVFWDRYVDGLAIAVAEPAPFSIELVQPKVPLVRNGTMQVKVVATRNEGFTEPINIGMPWRSPGVGAGSTLIAEGATEALIHINANDKAAVGPWPLVMTGKSSGYVVSSQVGTLEIAEPWMTFDVATVETEQGKPVELLVKVAQAQAFEGAAKAQLLGLPKGVTAPTLDVAADVTEVTFPLEVAADAAPGKHQNIFVQAVVTANEEPVLHKWGSGQVTVFKPLPPPVDEPEPEPQAAPEEPKPEEPERRTRFPKNQGS
jgi:hypothetical protein